MGKVWVSCDKCGHGWHGLPCTQWLGYMGTRDRRPCDCPTSCVNLPIIPQGKGPAPAGETC